MVTTMLMMGMQLAQAEQRAARNAPTGPEPKQKARPAIIPAKEPPTEKAKTTKK